MQGASRPAIGRTVIVISGCLLRHDAQQGLRARTRAGTAPASRMPPSNRAGFPQRSRLRSGAIRRSIDAPASRVLRTARSMPAARPSGAPPCRPRRARPRHSSPPSAPLAPLPARAGAEGAAHCLRGPPPPPLLRGRLAPPRPCGLNVCNWAPSVPLCELYGTTCLQRPMLSVKIPTFRPKIQPRTRSPAPQEF